LQEALPKFLPIVIHRDESVAEALANKQPLGDYAANSLASEEILTLANWCLIHLPEKIKTINA
jgi:cellulose biosynthesis protein BcsQ